METENSAFNWRLRYEQFFLRLFGQTAFVPPLGSEDRGPQIGGKHMTNEQREAIVALRHQGYGYIKIGQKLGISDNTVRSFCRRNGLDSDTMTNTVICKQCGKPIKIATGHKPRKFCSDACRTLWWNSHLDCVNRKAVYHFTCTYCGKPFSAYGNKNRKYCCHACYIAARFGEERYPHE